MIRIPPAEVVITVELVRELLAQQAPELADRPLVQVGEGWDHVMVRIGDDLAARLPRRQVAVPLIQNEMRCLARVSEFFPIPVPAPIREGVPSPMFRWPWTIVPWFDGQTADEGVPDPPELRRLGRGLRRLHDETHPGPAAGLRQAPLHERSDRVKEWLDRLSVLRPDLERETRAIWRGALDAGPPACRCWVHGDLHGRNAVTVEGRLAAVIDWGDSTQGDPAVDLACGWLVGEGAHSRAALLDGYGSVSPTRMARARGWALYCALILVLAGDEAHRKLGWRAMADLTGP